MSELTEKAREEFFSEAQDILSTLSRNLLALDEARKSRNCEPPTLVNEAFRAVHTLKGLAGLFGAVRLGALSHRLEDVLDALRLGRIALSAETLDVLFSSIDACNAVLELEKAGGGESLPSVDALLSELERLRESREPDQSSTAMEYELDSGVLAVLTEYEEHRLRANMVLGVPLLCLRVEFELATIDRALEDIKERASPLGEIVTYLPAGESKSPDSIALDLLFASKAAVGDVAAALTGHEVVITEIPHRRRVAESTQLSKRTDELAEEPRGESSPSTRERAPLAEGERSLRSLSRTVRVDIHRLDHLLNVVGELAIVRSSLQRLAERVRSEGQQKLGAELARLHRNFERRLSEMQDGILEVRLVPLGQVFERLARIVRQISRELDKEIRLVITGAETEIDKLIIEELSDPLMHMVRNAIAHGIEPTEQRASVGKPRAGTIALNAYPKGSHVVIEVEDDGRGVDLQALLEKAVLLGAVDPSDAAELSRDEILALMFLPGVSTRTNVDDVSGRGVGMDVVKTNIGKLGGVIDVHSEPGIGTKVAITLPITLAIVSALIVRTEAQVFALPVANVSEALRFEEAAVHVVEGREVITLRGSTLPVVRLSHLFELAPEPAAPALDRRYVVVVALGNRRLGIVVDHLLAQQDIVVKPLGKSLSSVRGFAGAAELGDQRVGLVLDTAAIIEEVLSGGDAPRRLVGGALG